MSQYGLSILKKWCMYLFKKLKFCLLDNKIILFGNIIYMFIYTFKTDHHVHVHTPTHTHTYTLPHTLHTKNQYIFFSLNMNVSY